MSRRTLDIVQAYSLRWLAEVFFQDWQSYEGWGRLARQPDEEGSRRGLILSLLRDHCLLLHPEQPARIENKLPARTVGSLPGKVKVDSLTQFFKDVIFSKIIPANIWLDGIWEGWSLFLDLFGLIFLIIEK